VLWRHVVKIKADASTQGVIVFDTAEDEHVVSVEHIGDDGEGGENGNGG
jgi:DNA gyrase subunit A